MPYQHFYELGAWKLAREMKLKVYPLLKRFPAEEKYELTSQLRRSVRSVAANISEGHGRRTAKDELNFCIIARGSLSETLNHLIDAFDSGYISKAELADFKDVWERVRKCLIGYMSFIQSKTLKDYPQKADGTVKEEELHYKSIHEVEQAEESIEAFWGHLEIHP